MEAAMEEALGLLAILIQSVRTALCFSEGVLQRTKSSYGTIGSSRSLSLHAKMVEGCSRLELEGDVIASSHVIAQHWSFSESCK